MSKGTIRLPESAISGGRIGTARIREQIAGAAARLASADVAPLDSAVRALTGTSSLEEAIGAPPGYVARIDALRQKELAAMSIASGVGTSVENVMAELAAAPSYSPIERMQQLGRGGGGKPNKTESAYGEQLAARMHNGEILWFRFEAIKLRLADNTFYTPDYPLITADGALEFHEVKGHWTDDARVKIKVAAAQYPFRFLAIQRDGRHGWRIEDLTSRSW